MHDTTLPWEAPVAADEAARVDVLSLSADDLGRFIESLGERPYRAKQLYAWLHQKRAASFEAMTDLSQALRIKLDEVAEIRRPAIADVRASKDGTRKYQLTTVDGHTIEAVFIPHASGPGRNALCISSQVGCAMGCTFCATAALKLTRHLTPGEIVGQIYAVMDDLAGYVADEFVPSERFDDDDDEEPEASPGTGERRSGERRTGERRTGERRTGERRTEEAQRITNVVYMGMGEPLHNLDNVIASIRLLTSHAGQGMSSRRITVSTSGLVPQMDRLGIETDVHLAVSLNATTDDVRKDIMPVDKRYNIEALLDATRRFPLKPRRRITFEYVMLAGVNDSDDDARRLVNLMRGQRAKVNLIPFNPHPLSPFARPDDARVEAFRAILDRSHISCFVRTTRGLDVDAACGMLGAKKLEQAREAQKGLPVL